MKCPFCGFGDSKVVDSRPTDFGSIRRRRECEGCRKRFTTYETIERAPLVVIKKDGTREAFDKDKMMRGLIKSCEKRPVTLHALEQMVGNIEQDIYNTLAQEVSSQQLGEMVMERLRDLDEISYIRFASVYRQFKDIGSFWEMLKNLVNDH